MSWEDEHGRFCRVISPIAKPGCELFLLANLSLRALSPAEPRLPLSRAHSALGGLGWDVLPRSSAVACAGL